MTALGDDTEIVLFRSPGVEDDDPILREAWEHILVPAATGTSGGQHTVQYMAPDMRRDGHIQAAGYYSLRSMLDRNSPTTS